MTLPIIPKFHTVGTISLVIGLIFPVFQTIGIVSLLIGTIGFMLPDPNKTKNARDARVGWKRNEVGGRCWSESGSEGEIDSQEEEDGWDGYESESEDEYEGRSGNLRARATVKARLISRPVRARN